MTIIKFYYHALNSPSLLKLILFVFIMFFAFSCEMIDEEPSVLPHDEQDLASLFTSNLSDGLSYSFETLPEPTSQQLSDINLRINEELASKSSPGEMLDYAVSKGQLSPYVANALRLLFGSYEYTFHQRVNALACAVSPSNLSDSDKQTLIAYLTLANHVTSALPVGNAPQANFDAFFCHINAVAFAMSGIAAEGLDPDDDETSIMYHLMYNYYWNTHCAE